MSEQLHDCVIIGAGMTGLACALSLVGQQHDVVVLDADNKPGGLLASYQFDQYTIEKYYHHFFSYDQNLLELIEQLELNHDLVWKKASTGYYHQGHVYNLDTPREILMFRGLSLIDKFFLAKAMLMIKRTKDFRHLDRITARDWLLQNTNQSVYENFFAPLLKSKFGSAADSISAAWLCARLKLRSNRKLKGEELGYFKHGFETLITKLVHTINETGQVKCSEKVINIKRNADETFTVQSQNATWKTRCLVSTVAPSILDQLAIFPESYRLKLEKNHSQSVICALIGLKKPLLKTYWLNIRSDSLPFALLIEHTHFHSCDNYAGEHLLYAASYQENEMGPLYRMPDPELIHTFQIGLETEFGLNPNDILWWRISRAAAVGPIYTINYLDTKLDHDTPWPGLFIGGMMTSYPERGLNVSVQQGQQCAQLVNSYLNG
ncbi:FAD-dependent oxidoreductase [bacterium]|nr:FAD-dependent oxidoreductase [bacterium]